ncbi:hypothetical protein P154DRAFT_567420 [Amniculicola lignicola CBS 123094]|uniref:Protection of telomeres protein 1 ssDNA-binding domain-containing protein n=1 Tax=Amniculicola lignicola CBS 123094 TaxID=1392246 RepID=A0A6A5W0A8_9PLEO|nr:hypothetical protein P154DRAFT_567420 [Amniculicola lignicola CBS 123094]
MQRPAGYKAIQDATDGERASFIGRLVDVAKYIHIIKQETGTVAELEFTVQDAFPGSKSSSIACRIWRRGKSDLPQLTKANIGDVVVVRNIQIGLVKASNHLIATSSWAAEGPDRASVFFFSANGIPKPEFSTGYGLGGNSRLPHSSVYGSLPPTGAEQASVISFNAATEDWRQRLAKRFSAPRPLPPSPRLPAGPSDMSAPKKQALIKDMGPSSFYNLVGEVVKFYSSDPTTTDIYVTDYTTNELLFFYEDPKDAEFALNDRGRQFPGPYGQMTIAIRLFEPHSSHFLHNMREGDQVYIQNLKTKISNSNKLEGWVQQDQRYPDKLQIHKLVDQRQRSELSARKAEYEKKKALMSALPNAPNEPKRASAISAAKRKEEKRGKKEMARVQREIEQKELEQKAEEKKAARAGINTHIVAAFPDVQLSSMEEIVNNPALHTTSHRGLPLTLPFVNAKYRARVRIVDFSPQDLKDFSCCLSDPTWNPTRERGRLWQWSFILLVEAANPTPGQPPEQLPVFMNNSNVQCLLKMNAVDLRDPLSSATLSQLEEKLFILWGNLLEQKKELMPKGVKFPLPSGDSRLQNLPFECCLEEYGVEVTPSDEWPQGWQRMHKMFGTSIMGN